MPLLVKQYMYVSSSVVWSRYHGLGLEAKNAVLDLVLRDLFLFFVLILISNSVILFFVCCWPSGPRSLINLKRIRYRCEDLLTFYLISLRTQRFIYFAYYVVFCC